MLRLLPVLIATSLITTSLFAADPAGFAVWKSGDLKGYEKSLAPKISSLKEG